MKREWDGHAGTAKRSMQATRSPLFTATDYILVVGESDFSFSLKLAQLVGGSNILASTLSSAEETNRIYPQAAINISSLEGYGAIVNYELDCTTKKMAQLDLQFDKIIFNFPEAAVGPDELEPAIPYNQHLLAGFFHEAGQLLMPKGGIYVSIKIGWPFDNWDVEGQGLKCRFLNLVDTMQLPCRDFPTYAPKCTSRSFYKWC